MSMSRGLFNKEELMGTEYCAAAGKEEALYVPIEKALEIHYEKKHEECIRNATFCAKKGRGHGKSYLYLCTQHTHSSTLAWKIPRTEEPGRLQSTGSQRVGQD